MSKFRFMHKYSVNPDKFDEDDGDTFFPTEEAAIEGAKKYMAESNHANELYIVEIKTRVKAKPVPRELVVETVDKINDK